MTVLSERSAREAAERRRRVLAAVDLPGGAAIGAGELAATLGIPPRVLSRYLAELTRQGLVVRSGERGPVRITAAGRSEVGGSRGDELMPALGSVLAALPCEAYRAMLRLRLAAVIARRHLSIPHPSGWPSFVAAGDTGDGKTLIARLMCRMLGLAEPTVIRLVQNETAGSLFARRERAAGRYRVDVSPVLGYPYLCLDELDKARDDKQAAAWRLMQGDARADFEGELLSICPVVYGCMNIDPAAAGREINEIPRPFLRRAVVLDTRTLAPLLTDVDEVAALLLEPGRPAAALPTRSARAAVCWPSSARAELAASQAQGRSDR